MNLVLKRLRLTAHNRRARMMEAYLDRRPRKFTMLKHNRSFGRFSQTFVHSYKESLTPSQSVSQRPIMGHSGRLYGSPLFALSTNTQSVTSLTTHNGSYTVVRTFVSKVWNASARSRARSAPTPSSGAAASFIHKMNLSLPTRRLIAIVSIAIGSPFVILFFCSGALTMVNRRLCAPVACNDIVMDVSQVSVTFFALAFINLRRFTFDDRVSIDHSHNAIFLSKIIGIPKLNNTYYILFGTTY